MPGVTIKTGSVHLQNAETGQFEGRVAAGTDAAAASAAQQGADEARSILGGKWGGGVHIGAVGGGGEWEIEATGQWAEAAEFGIPGHPIDTEKYSLYNPEEGFPSILNSRGKPIQVQHVDHPGVLEMRMIETAGDIIAHEFEGILVSYLP